MESSQVNVLITGGTGFIGSRLGLRCLTDGHSVRILGQENTAAESSNRKLLEEKGARIRLASVTRKELLPELLEGIDVVYHLAAAQHEVNVPDERFREVNVQGTANLLEAGVAAGVRRFVHGSTIGVYGQGMEGRIDENSPLQPDNIYGKTKLEGENIVLSFKDRLPVVILRIPETYGPGDRKLLKLFKAIRKGVFFMIGDGKNLHHLIHIDDLIDAFSLAAERPDAIGNIFVVAGEEPVTTNEMVAVIAERMGTRIPGFHVPLSPLMLLANLMETACQPFGIKPPIYPRRMDFFRKNFAYSLEKSKNILGFQPKISFREGISSTADWYSSMNLLQ
jgi:nucleoside-diphosphate-sugar epimerase